MKQGDNFFIRTNKFIAPFSGLFDDQFGNDSDINVYHVFPNRYLKNLEKGMIMFLMNKVKELPHDKIVWAYTKKNIDFNRIKMEIRSSFYTIDTEQKKRIYVNIKVKNIIYEDSYYLVVRPQSININLSPLDS